MPRKSYDNNIQKTSYRYAEKKDDGLNHGAENRIREFIVEHIFKFKHEFYPPY